MKIAIVEDDRAILQMYRLKFEAEGYKVFTAPDGAKGLVLVEKNKPDIVLLDLMMPEMTGDEMLTKMRATDWGKDVKVIILTNVSKDEASPALKDLNVEDYIIKAQFTPKQVVETVEAVLAK